MPSKAVTTTAPPRGSRKVGGTLAGCVVEPVPVHFQPIVRVR
jgi:hypothetical protein